MIDMHSHCLPYIDDGPNSIETSLEMLETAKLCGARTVVATPHFLLSKISIDDFLKKRQDAIEQVSKYISAEPDKYPHLLTGAEVLLTRELCECESLNKLSYENTDYMLLELSSVYTVASMAEWIYNISMKGIKPIIAHIDRYTFCNEIMNELSDVDVIYQINSAFFLRLFASGEIKDLLKYHDKFIVASDMHNMGHRCFNLHKAYEKAKKITPHTAKEMFCDLPSKILNNTAF